MIQNSFATFIVACIAFLCAPVYLTLLDAYNKNRGSK